MFARKGVSLKIVADLTVRSLSKQFKAGTRYSRERKKVAEVALDSNFLRRYK